MPIAVFSTMDIFGQVGVKGLRKLWNLLFLCRLFFFSLEETVELAERGCHGDVHTKVQLLILLSTSHSIVQQRFICSYLNSDWGHSVSLKCTEGCCIKWFWARWEHKRAAALFSRYNDYNKIPNVLFHCLFLLCPSPNNIIKVVHLNFSHWQSNPLLFCFAHECRSIDVYVCMCCGRGFLVHIISFVCRGRSDLSFRVCF